MVGIYIMKLFRTSIKRNIRKMFLQPYCSNKIRSKFRSLDNIGMERLRASLESNFYSNETPDFLSSEEGKRDLDDHLHRTLELNRNYIIPWLNSMKELDGAKILEIGCGTGATSVALAEQRAEVIGLDIDQSSLKVAIDRCDIYNLNVKIMHGNATDIKSLFPTDNFNFIIFYASLEHMTYEERMTSLVDAWSLLSNKGVLCIIEAPNRLWYFDSHTSGLPFYYWLPDEIAIKYSRFSSRRKFKNLSQAPIKEACIELMRWGRGVSYHEFELALEGVDLKSGVSCSSIYARKQRIMSRLKWWFSKERRHEKLLQSMMPDIHAGFFQPYLNIAIQK